MDLFAFLAAITPWEIIDILTLAGVVLLAGLLFGLIPKWWVSTWPFEICGDAGCTAAGTMAARHLVEIAVWAHDPPRGATPEQVTQVDILVQVCLLHGTGPYIPPVTGTTPHWRAVHKAWDTAKTATNPGDWDHVIEELTHGA